MARTSKSTVTWVVVLICVGVIFIFRFLSPKAEFGSTRQTARSKGNPQADLKVVEYVDFQCPACAQGSRILRKQFEDHPDDLYLEIRYFPLSGHSHGMLSARYAECSARQGKFWEVHDMLFDRQSFWRNMINAEPSFRKIAEDAGVNLRQLDACLKDNRLEETILKDKDEGTALGIKSTPTYFINSEMQVGTKSLSGALQKHFQE